MLIARKEGHWDRLRMCAAEDCGWIFFDASRNGRGRWCATRVCGNRLRTRNYRARRMRAPEPSGERRGGGDGG
jgi:predicted RNA-binding Zn ribbon-like protein